MVSELMKGFRGCDMIWDAKQLSPQQMRIQKTNIHWRDFTTVETTRLKKKKIKADKVGWDLAKA